VTAMSRFRQWWFEKTGERITPLNGQLPAFGVSFVVHLCAIVGLGLIPLAVSQEEVAIHVTSAPMEDRFELETPQEFAFNDLPSEEIGSSSVQGEAMAMSLAPVISEVSVLPQQMTAIPVENANIEFNNILQQATGLHYSENLTVRGAAGEGTTGAAGAIDRITHEILLSMEERKTLVVWLFDQTESLIPQRKAIRERFSKIYEELGVVESTRNEAFAKHDQKPLLSSVVGFGNTVKFMTEKPTDSLAELSKAVTELPKDNSGTENVFGAITEVAKRYASFRQASGEKTNSNRNVMIVVFTDEAGSDTNRAEETVRMCRRWAMPVYVIGVPAPFGRQEAKMKWIDPDPRYNQEPQWGIVEQGPETHYPEQVKLSFRGSWMDEEALDSGFGPYALTRLCVESGGIYFTVHPNRDLSRRVTRGEISAFSAHLSRFYDPEVMRKYRPEYVSIPEYEKRVKENKARKALTDAAKGSNELSAMENPRREFVKADEAEFARILSEAQQAAAAIEPRINALLQVLQVGEADREKEMVPRWQAGYDLAMGRTLAMKVRTESYNAMLAAAKRGLKPSAPKNNVWNLEPSNEIGAGSNFVKMAERAKMYLARVAKDHPNTPWATLAERELQEPMGWKWKDSFRDMTPKKKAMPAANNNNAPPRNEKMPMNAKPPVTRPLPKL
jgi:hypothetical protein